MQSEDKECNYYGTIKSRINVTIHHQITTYKTFKKEFQSSFSSSSSSGKQQYGSWNLGFSVMTFVKVYPFKYLLSNIDNLQMTTQTFSILLPTTYNNIKAYHCMSIVCFINHFMARVYVLHIYIHMQWRCHPISASAIYKANYCSNLNTS